MANRKRKPPIDPLVNKTLKYRDAEIAFLGLRGEAVTDKEGRRSAIGEFSYRFLTENRKYVVKVQMYKETPGYALLCIAPLIRADALPRPRRRILAPGAAPSARRVAVTGSARGV